MNHLKEDQTEYNYIVKFVSHIYTMLSKDKLFLDCNSLFTYCWFILYFNRGGEKTLHCSAILLNQSTTQFSKRSTLFINHHLTYSRIISPYDDRQCSGNKIDTIISILELDLEFSTLEVSESSSCLITFGDSNRNKPTKMLKIILIFCQDQLSWRLRKV